MNEELNTQTAHRDAGKHFDVNRLTFLPPTVAGLIKLVHRSCSFTVLGQEHETQALSRGQSILYACWHFAYPAIVYHFRDRNGMLMVSRSRDGEFMANILKYFGFTVARGSPGVDKGGGTALKRMMGHTRKGYPAGLIADGSQGPPLIAQRGILVLAQYTRAPLVPVSMAANRCRRFPSWDKTLLAKPFARVAVAFGPAIWVKRNSSPEELEAQRVELENGINRLTVQCEQAVGNGPPAME
ncbi:MAG: lysophospholipid acyltransferase family protein [Syntrophobacteraceae bacterium]